LLGNLQGFKNYIDDEVVEIISAESFTPQQKIIGFDNIGAGLNLTLENSARLNGTAYAAQNIQVTSPNRAIVGANSLVRSDIDNSITGIINFKNGLTVGIDPTFKYGSHAFHIHNAGDLRRGCDSCCKHYNPTGVDHGGLENGHAGDLGNLEFDEKGNCKMTLRTNKFNVIDIVGRSVIVHENEDDLGLGTGESAAESIKTGNSGKRIACSVIGYAESTCE
jgi:Cu/Zn superoxide dismutase